MTPGLAAFATFAARHAPPGSRALFVGDAPPATLEAAAVSAEDALARLQASPGAFDAIVAPWPTRALPLLPFLSAARDALAPGGRLVLCDLVWQTAPTPELLRAFAAAAGRDKVRPIEGYEMQIDHAGFDIIERAELPRADWAPALAPDARAAVEADARGAARVAGWVLAAQPDDG